MNRTAAKPTTKKSAPAPDCADVAAVLDWLKRRGKKSVRDGMARFAIPADKAFGIPVGDLRKYAKSLGQNHALATALWDTGWYEAAPAGGFRRGAGAGHARGNGPLVPGLRQLGRLRYGLLSFV